MWDAPPNRRCHRRVVMSAPRAIQAEQERCTGLTLGCMGDAPPPYGSQDWIDAELLAISKTYEGEERWPTSQDPAPDSVSNNNKRNENWLDEQEWPTAANKWHSRKGHPLTPVDGERYHHAWVDVHSLAGVRLNRASAANTEEPIGPSPGPPPGPDFSELRRPHVIQGMHGGGFEAVEQEYQRALELAGGSQRAIDEMMAMRRRPQERWPPIVHTAVAAAAAAEPRQHAQILHDEAVGTLDVMRQRQRDAPAATGYRPGSQLQRVKQAGGAVQDCRRGIGNVPWNGAPAHGTLPHHRRW